ncbi:ras-associated and pleckstrin homology domains-containing protein 1-like [Athalia rosae]|uniref:ras-associated and pleckstrin homology domains-containing protein 1-like n=1 Tax=Athalia rosae TaxID=37344 RepID=UPI0020343291|nr:ras-associated and pleckstrin homology domains-containing protein 1-like [Athalia rosae]
MAKFLLLNIFLLSLATCGLTINIRDIFGFGYPRFAKPEERQSVEIIRWRQPVCITAAPGVLPCLVGFADHQRPVQTEEENVGYEPEQIIDLIDIKSQSPVKEDLKTFWSKHDSDLDDLSLESIEIDPPHLTKRSAPKLYSPKVVRYVKLEDMGESTLENPASQSARGGRYLRVAPQMGRATYRDPNYDVKIVDSPVMANLVAHTCLPDIGIPLCSELGGSTTIPIAPIPLPSKPVLPLPLPPNPLPSIPAPSKPLIPLPGFPSLSSLPSILPLPSLPNVSSQVTLNISNSIGNLTPLQLPGQAVIQSIGDYLNKPTVVQSNGEPEIKPVIVVQPTSSPGILAGINAFLAPNGNNWFNPLAGNPLIGLVNLSALPVFSPLPGIPSLQEILQRPENEISRPPGLLGILGIPNNQSPPPSAGPPTEKPGIFGGIFSSPSRPTALEDATNPTRPTLLGGIGNIFNQPTNRPLVIERPDENPIVVERPVYVVEQPVTQGLLDIFQKPNRPIILNTTKEPEVIKDPTYVLQRPTENPLTGLLGNWNIFNRPTTQSPPPVVIIDKEPNPGRPTVVINTPPQNYSPAIMPTNPQLPAFPVKPGLVSSSSSSVSSASSTSSVNGISNSFAASSASSVVNPLGPSSSSSLAVSLASSAAKKGEDSAKTVDAVPQTNLDSENSGLREGGESKAPIRDVPEVAKVQGSKEKILPEGQAAEGDKFKDIDAVPIDEQVHNEA